VTRDFQTIKLGMRSYL